MVLNQHAGHLAHGLGWSRFLRDAPPVTYDHAGDSTMMRRGSLGHVIGVVDYGECVKPLERRYVHVSLLKGERRFIHEWVLVTDRGITGSENDAPCGRSQRPPAAKI